MSGIPLRACIIISGRVCYFIGLVMGNKKQGIAGVANTDAKEQAILSTNI